MCRPRYAGMFTEQVGVGVGGGVYPAGHTRMLVNGGCPTWPAPSSYGACGYGCILTLTHARTARPERARALGLADLAAYS